MAKAIMRKDLTGQKFGMLTVRCVDEERTGNGKVYWICDCECGGKKSILSTSLTRRNGTKSCGCLKHKPVSKEKMTVQKADMIGKRFGRLVVVGEAGYKLIGKNNRKKLQYYCNCDCGTKNHIVVGEYLRSGTTTSCGCVYKESRKEIAKVYNKYDLDSYTYGVGYCQNGEKFFFDKDDYDKIKKYCWSYDGRYVQAHTLYRDNYTTKIIRLHRLVLDIYDREDINVDHKNLIRYDCRKSNLRRATDEENARNKIECYATLENPVGIYMENDKYSVCISKQRIGTFDTFEDAFKVRKQKEIELFGDFQWNPDANKIYEITSNNICDFVRL